MTKFPVHLLTCISQRTLLPAIGDNLQFLTEGAPVLGGRETFDFSLESSRGQAALRRRIDRVLNRGEKCSVIVISDGLTASESERGLVPNELVREIRNKFFDSHHLCGLVALVPGVSRRIRDIDRTVDCHTLSRESLRSAVMKAANGLRLKAPPPRDPVLGDNDAVKVQAVQSQEQLEECLRLRFQVYDVMGYLEDAVSESPTKIEIDSFDLNSIHFVAFEHNSGRVVGTTRLVVTNVARGRNTLIGDPFTTLRRHREWGEAIVEPCGDAALRQRLESPYFWPLPILQSGDFRERWDKVLREANRGGEISRVVVSPEYRGTGVSSLLMRCAIATAYSINKRFLLLECLPIHEKMYAKYGFGLLEGHHTRLQELDQVAIGMRLELRKDPNNRAFWIAQQDTERISAGKDDDAMLSGTKYLCVCRLRPCWSQAGYQLKDHPVCPLREERLNT
ncbi:MAG: GNAT family N-acetyltransferase [Phycisphaerales bacterium]|nr:MAG: GNAT family N-acetyltransferase [Phycisphaerales bacterium]